MKVTLSRQISSAEAVRRALSVGALPRPAERQFLVQDMDAVIRTLSWFQQHEETIRKAIGEEQS